MTARAVACVCSETLWLPSHGNENIKGTVPIAEDDKSETTAEYEIFQIFV